MHGQELIATSLNLDPGASIFDVVDIPPLNCYLIVGDFNEVNGIPRKKLAFLDKNTLQLKLENVYNPISLIDGDIYCAEVHFYIPPILPAAYSISIYLGGNFNNISLYTGLSNPRNGIAKLTTMKTIANTFPNNFSLNTWNPQLDISADPNHGVKSMDVSNDTLFFSGDFTAINNNALPTDIRPSGISAVNIKTNANLNMYNDPNSPMGVGRIKYHEGKLYAVGGIFNTGTSINSAGLVRLNHDGTIDSSFPIFGYQSTGECGCEFGVGNDIEFLNDSLLLLMWDNVTIPNLRNADVDTTYINGSSYLYSSNLQSFNTSMAVYKNYNYCTRNRSLDDPLNIFSPSIYCQKFSESPSPSGNFYDQTDASFDDYTFEHIWIEDNLMFISDDDLFEIGYPLGMIPTVPRVGLAIYCLEPKDAENFISLDTMLCPGDTVLYSINEVEFANGYVWTYTGQGIDIGLIGTENVSDTIQNAAAYNVNIGILDNFTPGTLSVTPFSNFNGNLVNANNIVTSNTISINLYSNPLPHANAGPDTSLNCYTQSSGIELYGYSDSTVVSYGWLNDFPNPNTIGQYKTALEPGNYVFRVESPLGCPNYDTVFVSMDTVPPTPVLPVPPYELTCANSELALNGSTPNLHTILEWYIATDDTLITNPINTSSIGEHQLIATDTLNGCSKTTAIYVSLNDDPPNIAIYGYPVISGSQPIDTLTCFQPSLSLQAYSDTLNSDVSWINADTTEFYGDVLNISSSGEYMILATNNNNGCTNSLGIFISEYLNEPHIAMPDNNVLNCSTDSLVLEGFSLDANTDKFWSSSSLPSATNPITVYDAGVYYFTVTNPENGCQSIDSVIITTDNSITVNAGEDLYYCDKEIVSLIATYVGSISGIQYAWSDGTDLAVADYTAGVDEFAVVVVSGDGGCVGTDTVYLFTPPVPEMIIEGFKPCDDGPSGQIVVTPISGFDPFQYAINGSAVFQNSTVFSNLNVGSYVITVRDSLGCDYAYNAVIDNNSSLPEPTFMFSTYNFESDTVVIVDVSNPPTDSTIWIFPNEIVVLDDDALSPMVLLPDTGTFEIVMQAYYGDCLVELSKWIYASPYDSLTASLYNQNGIKSVELYPNPTTGNFTVHFEFYKEQRSAIAVQDVLGTTYFFNSYDENLAVTESITLDNTAIDGTYVVKIISEFDGASITFILAR